MRVVQRNATQRNVNPHNAPIEPEALWDKRVTARYLGINSNTLDRWIAQGRGPLGMRVGKQVRYSPASVQEFLASCQPVGGRA